MPFGLGKMYRVGGGLSRVLGKVLVGGGIGSKTRIKLTWTIALWRAESTTESFHQGIASLDGFLVVWERHD